MVLRRGGITEIALAKLRALATHRPIWGRIAPGALELCLLQIR